MLFKHYKPNRNQFRTHPEKLSTHILFHHLGVRNSFETPTFSSQQNGLIIKKKKLVRVLHIFMLSFSLLIQVCPAAIQKHSKERSLLPDYTFK